MRVLSSLLAAVFLLASLSCSAQKINLAQPEPAEAGAEQYAENRYAETVQQMSEELLAGSWLSSFAVQHTRKPYLLIVFSPTEQSEAKANLKELLTQTILDSGKLNLVLPKDNWEGFTLPRDKETSSSLHQESGADYLLHCSFLDFEDSGVQFELLDLATAEIVYSKAIINHKLKT